MALTPRDMKEIEEMIARAVSAAGARVEPSMPAYRLTDRISRDELREITEHGRMLILPGAHKSRFLYCFLLDEDGNAIVRVPVLKRSMRDMLVHEVEAHGRDLLDGAAVVLEGEFPITRAISSRR